MSVNLASLVEATESKGYATASSWRGYLSDGCVEIWHYRTLMVRLERQYGYGNWYARAVSNGYGSRSDRQGIGKILQGCRAVNARSYRELYGYVPMDGGDA